MVAGARYAIDRVGGAAVLPSWIQHNETAVTVANTTAQTSLFAVLPTVPADIAAGEVLRLEYWGEMTSTTAASIQHFIDLGAGAFDGMGSPTIAQTAIANIRHWRALIEARCITAPGTFAHSFIYEINDGSTSGIGTTAIARSPLVGGRIPVALTAPMIFDHLVTWTVAAATNSITCRGWALERSRY